MGVVDHLHVGVAIVRAAEGAPVFGVGVESIRLLFAALECSIQTDHQTKHCLHCCGVPLLGVPPPGDPAQWVPRQFGLALV